MPELKERVSLRGLLWWLAVLGLVLVLLAAAGVGVRTRQAANEAEEVLQLAAPAAEAVYTLSLATSDMQRGLTLYALGGFESDLRPYVDGERRSSIALSSLERLVGGDEEVEPLLAAVESSRSAWIDLVAQPAIKAMRAGRDRVAERIIVDDKSLVLYDQFITDSERLRYTIDQSRLEAFAQLTEQLDRLFRLVVIVVCILMIAVVAAGLLMFRWVLAPLDDLRRQIREVARRGNHESPILPGGPREIAAVGVDAEKMRRQLVSEIDEARSAREALEHRVPLVAAIRRELSIPTDPRVPGLRVYGEVTAAEGVLAGDWWDCVAMPSGEAALIIADIAGHGPEAGVAAMRIKHTMALLLASGAEPDDAMSLASRSFADEVGRFATVVLVCVHPEDGAVRWVNGGHHPPVILAEDGGTRSLEPTGPLLSWLGGPWRVEHTTLAPGEVLLAFSDGLVESHGSDGEQLEVQGMLDLFRDAGSDLPIEESVQRTLAQARDRAVDWERDDVTLVAVALDPAGAGARAAAVQPPLPGAGSGGTA